jgi:hypothetical protein
MNFNCHCLEGLTIPSLTCCPSRKSKSKVASQSPTSPQSKSSTRINIVNDMALKLCVANSPHQCLHTIGVENNAVDTESWDYIDIDCDKQIVMYVGRRFDNFRIHTAVNGRLADSDRGKQLTQVFYPAITDFFLPLCDEAFMGLSSQIHTIYHSHSMTLFVYPLKNETGKVIGAHIIYRPTTYSKKDIASFISHGTQQKVTKL